MRKLSLKQFLTAKLFLVAIAGISGCSTFDKREEALQDSVTLYASFNQGLDADYALGDKTLYGAAHRNRPQNSVHGLPEGSPIQLAKEGRFGDALRFTAKSDAMVFFKGEKNFDYQQTNWSGSISFWLKLDPNKDLQPGYCDPLQISAGSWNNGVFFAEFSKDDPRRFRFALRPLFSIWNPKKLGWEAIPVKERPMVEVDQPPFGRDQWTHVVFTFTNANSGQNDGVGRLFLNGEFAGEFNNWQLTVNWNREEIMVNLGVFYVGLMDELALFNRALNENEVKYLYERPNGLSGVLSNASR